MIRCSGASSQVHCIDVEDCVDMTYISLFPNTGDGSVKSHGEASLNEATSSSSKENSSSRHHSAHPTSSDSSSKSSTTDAACGGGENSAGMQISISPEIITHVRWPKVQHLLLYCLPVYVQHAIPFNALSMFLVCLK